MRLQRATGMTSTIRCAALAACLLLTTSASAQDRLYAGGHAFGAVGLFGRDLGPAPQVPQDSLFDGNRYSATMSGMGGMVFVTDGRSGQGYAYSGFLLATDQARPTMFLARADGIWQIDVMSGLDARIWPGDGTLVEQCAHAESPNRLYCSMARSDGRSDVVVIDVPTRSATTLTALQLATPFGGYRVSPSTWKVTSDGRRVYFIASGGTLAMFDTMSGAVVVSGVQPAGHVGRTEMLRMDAVTGRVFVFDANDVLHLFSDALTPVAAAATGATCTNLATSPHTGRLYLARFNLLTQCPRCGGGTSNVTFEAFDAVNYASLAGPDTPPVIFPWEYTCSLTVLSAPGPPRDVAATVNGSDVTLTWTNVGSASGFVLHVGFAPGRTDVQAYLGPDATFHAVGVPAGTYYLRLRGGNEVGGGRPSNEVRIVVPGR